MKHYLELHSNSQITAVFSSPHSEDRGAPGVRTAALGQMDSLNIVVASGASVTRCSLKLSPHGGLQTTFSRSLGKTDVKSGVVPAPVLLCCSRVFKSLHDFIHSHSHPGGVLKRYGEFVPILAFL